MRRRFGLIIASITICLHALTALAQDSSSVYTTNRGTGVGGPIDWLLGRGRPAAKVIRVPQDRSAVRSYQPRRRSAPVYRPAVPERPAAGDPMAPAEQGPQQDASPDGLPKVPATDAPPAAAALPVVPSRPIVNVAVIGDSLSIFLAQGLQETYADRPDVHFIRRSREASGIVRDDYYDWPRQLRDLLAASPKPDVIILQLGSNDRQQLRDADGVHEPRSDRWMQIYAKRIDDLIAIAKEKSVPLIWVGLPPMRGERYSADLLAFNGVYRSRASAAATPYVDIWEAFAGEDGVYAVSGPDVDGTNVRLRTADGVHFTKAGTRKLAFFADKELRKIISSLQDKAAPALTSVTGTGTVAPTIANLPSISEPPPIPDALKSTDQLLGVPLPDIALPSALVPRPAQGATASLTATPLSTGGRLQDGRALPAATNALPAAKPGRADDFRAQP